MKHKIIYSSTLFLLLLITGVFWGTWFTLTRTIESFSASEFVHIGKVIISNVAWPMRIIMPTGILLMLLSLWLFREKRSVGFYLGSTGLLLMIGALLVTLLVLVPIDNDIKQWTDSTMPANWFEIREKWKIFHAVRTFASLGAFALFTYAVFSLKTKRWYHA